MFCQFTRHDIRTPESIENTIFFLFFFSWEKKIISETKYTHHPGERIERIFSWRPPHRQVQLGTPAWSPDKSIGSPSSWTSWWQQGWPIPPACDDPQALRPPQNPLKRPRDLQVQPLQDSMPLSPTTVLLVRGALFLR